MKKTVISLLITLLGISFASAQYVQRPEEVLPTRPIITTAPPVFNLDTGENGWRISGGPYTDDLLYAFVVKIVIEELGWHAGKDLLKILQEAYARDQLKQIVYVKQDNPRLREATIDIAGWHIKIATGGASNSRRGTLRVGNIELGGETGSAEAWISLVFTDLVSQREVAVIVGNSKRSSTNLERLAVNVRSNRSFLGIPLSDRISWDVYDRDPVYRLGMLTTLGALEGLRPGLRKLKEQLQLG